MAVNLSGDYGRVEVTYLTGPGRAVGDLYAEITRQTISNGDGVDVINRDAIDPIRLPLDGYIQATARLNVPFTITSVGRPDSRNFSQLTFDPNRILVETATGFSDAGTLPSNLPVVLDARIRAFAGRTATVPLYVSSTSLSNVDGSFTFNADDFKSKNYSVSGTDPEAQNRVASRLSDFVRFPLANVSEDLRPQLRDGSGSVIGQAGYVYFSGDNVALSSPTGGSGSVFQEVGDNFDDVVIGKWASGTSSGFQGTYDLRDNLPPTPEGSPFSQIAVYGGYRDYNQVLSNIGTFEVLMLPNSGETYTFEGNAGSGVRGRLGDIVAFVRNGNNQITNIYFGGVDLGARTFELFPISALGLDPADPTVQAQRIEGTVNGYLDQNGQTTSNNASIRKFTYQFTSNVSGLSGFSTTGTATVFRK